MVFILVIAALVQFVEMFLKKAIPPLYTSLGIFLPLITTNCCVLGLAILVQREEFDLLTALFYSFSASVGFMLALILMAGIRERLALCRTPRALQGTPLGLIMAGLLSLCFMALKGRPLFTPDAADHPPSCDPGGRPLLNKKHTAIHTGRAPPSSTDH